MIYFTADHHFNHAKIIDYCNRPFNSVDEMNSELIKRWNQKVNPDDIVYHLGDFCFGDFNKAARFFSNLNGRINILVDNFSHDQRWSLQSDVYYSKSGSFISFLNPIELVKINKMYIILCHYPIEEWNRKYYGSIHFHGHSHGNSRKMENRYDVGVDCWDFYPVTLDEILFKRMIENGNV